MPRNMEGDVHGEERRDSDTVSLTPDASSRMFSYRNGRRYNAHASDHFLPNDDEEIYRLELQHKAVVRSLRQLHTVPCLSFERVLDAGCGPGWWTVDFADEHPECTVIGIDLVPIQPQEIPPNLSFECDDICQGLRFPDNHFDMIYSRKLYSSIVKWEVYMKELIRVLKPGGYLNCVEVDIEHPAYLEHGDTAFARWSAGLVKMLHSLGMNPTAATDLKPCMKQAGLENLTEHWFIVPGGTSSRATAYQQETARLMTQSTLLSLSALKEAYGVANELYDEDLDLFLSEVRRDLLDPRNVWQGIWVSVVGQKV